MFAIVTLLACLSVPWHAEAADGRADLDLLGQVRDGDQSRKTEAPVDLYGKIGADRLWGQNSIDTYFRLERDLARDDGASDFYAGYARLRDVVSWLDMTGGRQFLAEGPTGVFVADAGKVRIDPQWPVSFSFYGGAPQYFEPTYSSAVISQDETLFGGTIARRSGSGGNLNVGYQQHEREGRTLSQLITGAASQSLGNLPGKPDLYGSIAFDADGSNLDLANAGVSFAVPRTRLSMNFGTSYYKPQDQGSNRIQTDLERREDTIFEAFSTSELLQFRGALTYPFTTTLSLHADYSFQRYEISRSNVEHGHIGGAGLSWLPGGDGLEVVRLEYFVRDSGGGNVNGIDFVYINSVYERIVFRLQANVAYYEKDSNQSDVPVSTLIAVAYEVLPGLNCEVNMEANRNDRFDSDFRFGFRVAYQFRHEVPLPSYTEDKT